MGKLGLAALTLREGQQLAATRREQARAHPPALRARRAEEAARARRRAVEGIGPGGRDGAGERAIVDGGSAAPLIGPAKRILRGEGERGIGGGERDEGRLFRQGEIEQVAGRGERGIPERHAGGDLPDTQAKREAPGGDEPATRREADLLQHAHTRLGAEIQRGEALAAGDGPQRDVAIEQAQGDGPLCPASASAAMGIGGASSVVMRWRGPALTRREPLRGVVAGAVGRGVGEDDGALAKPCRWS